jgi:hypothetical protein
MIQTVALMAELVCSNALTGGMMPSCLDFVAKEARRMA